MSSSPRMPARPDPADAPAPPLVGRDRSSAATPPGGTAPTCGYPVPPSTGGWVPSVDDPAGAQPKTLAYPSRPAEAVPTIDGYDVLEPLGGGGMGVVYKARHRRLGHLVALKVIRGVLPSSALRDRFLREAKAVAALRDPGIVAVHDFGDYVTADGTVLPFMSMEFCSAGSLADRLKPGPLSGVEAAELVSGLARSMQKVHDEGIIHRDLKPANILLQDRSPGSRADLPATDAASRPAMFRLREVRAKIADFGLARVEAGSGETTYGRAMGTPSYMPPEQADGRTEAMGPLSDVYSLGAILYECLTGKPPFLGSTQEQTLALVRAEPPAPPRAHNSRVHADLETICLKCLEKDPARRYGSAAELADDLDRFLNNVPIVARPVGRVERLRMWAKRSPAQAAAVALAALLAVTAATAAVFGVAFYVISLRNDVMALKEKSRLDLVGKKFEDAYAEARGEAARIADGDLDGWAGVAAVLEPALRDLDAEPGAWAANRQAGRDLLAKARSMADGGRERKALRERLARLREFHSEATLFGSLAAGIDPLDSRARARVAVTRALELFGLTRDGTGGPKIPPGLLDPKEEASAVALVREALLVEAWVTLQPMLQEDDKDPRAAYDRARRLLDRADALDRRPRGRASWFLRKLLAEAEDRADEKRAAGAEEAKTEAVTAADYYLPAVDDHLAMKPKTALELLELLKQAKADPSHYGAEFLRAKCLVMTGKYAEALAPLNACLALQPAIAHPLLLRALAWMQQKVYDNARADLDAILKGAADTETRYAALVARSLLSFQRGEQREGFEQLQEAIRSRPKSQLAYVSLAQVYRDRWRDAAVLRLLPLGLAAHEEAKRQRMSDLDRALDTLTAAISHLNTLPRLYFERGQVYALRGNAELARGDFRTAMARSTSTGPGDLRADSLLALAALDNDRGKKAQQAGRKDEATAAFTDALNNCLQAKDLDPNKPNLYRLLAEPQLALGRSEDAAESLKEHLRRAFEVVPMVRPEDQARLAADCLALGLIYSHLGRNAEAVQAYSRGLDPFRFGTYRDTRLLLQRGLLHLRTGSAAFAEQDLTSVLSAETNNVEARLARAEARARLDKIAEARVDVNSAETFGGVTTPPHLAAAARVYALLARQIARRDKNDRAIAAFEQTATRYLARAFQAVPAAEQDAFFRRYVEKEPAFAVVRRQPEFRRFLIGPSRP